MQSHVKLYSFIDDRVCGGGGGGGGVVRGRGGGGFVGFHSGVMKERLVDFNFYKRFLIRRVNEQFHSHQKLKI